MMSSTEQVNNQTNNLRIILGPLLMDLNNLEVEDKLSLSLGESIVLEKILTELSKNNINCMYTLLLLDVHEYIGYIKQSNEEGIKMYKEKIENIDITPLKNDCEEAYDLVVRLKEHGLKTKQATR